MMLSHICEGMALVYAHEEAFSIDAESDRVSYNGVWRSGVWLVNGGTTCCVSRGSSNNCGRFGSLADVRR